MNTPYVVIHADADTLAASAAARLITRLVDIQAQGRTPSVALTGGGTGIAVLTQVAASPARDAVDWSNVEILWGDERFVPADDAERNAGQARTALLDVLPLDPAKVHEMAASDGEFGDDLDAAAAAYAAVIPPCIDVVLLGMGPEGHVASVFPHSPALAASGVVTAVRDCPKPPPSRISLTLSAIRSADQVWMLVSGEGKAEAVAAAVGGADEADWPAAGARGRSGTWWLIDRAAAGRLP